MRDAMLISCVMVTRVARLEKIAQSVADFLSQTYELRELVIIHDGSLDDHDRIVQVVESLSQRFPRRSPIAVHRVGAQATLGALRNLAIQRSQGDLICQWDDDDRYHPLRLDLQFQALQSKGADACFLADQLHYFTDDRRLSWDDWSVEPYPLDFVPGTMLALRAELPAYPEWPRGEDSSLVLALLAKGKRIARLKDSGWCYVYVHHGDNVWSREHHDAIVRMKSLSEARLRARWHILRARLGEYANPVAPRWVNHAQGAIPYG